MQHKLQGCLTFPTSRLEMRVRTFIIVVGATGLKLETENAQN